MTYIIQAELSTGLALNFGLPDDAISILTKLEIEYHKKARGDLIAECSVLDVPKVISERHSFNIQVATRDKQGDIVTTAKAQWLVGPARR
mmetsp:Transcript_2385/g.4941  ORF Transcript_2385/g.4941 Transcript_2385/m.4941 type:complete len:90 (+) Transcript_2385:449-718(+)